MTFIDYLDGYIKSHPSFEETLVPINLKYHDEIEMNWANIGSEEFRKIARNLPENISRKFIFDSFKNNEDYKGYVATMLWGAKGKVGDGGIQTLNMSMQTSSNDIRKIIANVRTYLNQSDLQKAYHLLERKSHIPYVGVAYFTKLLFFLSTNKNNPRPLIYDTKLKRIHKALSIDSGFHLHKSYTYGDYNNYLQRISELVERYKNSPIMTSAEKDHPQGLFGRMEMILFCDEIQRIAKNYINGNNLNSNSSDKGDSRSKSNSGKIEKHDLTNIREKYKETEYNIITSFDGVNPPRHITYGLSFTIDGKNCCLFKGSGRENGRQRSACEIFSKSILPENIRTNTLKSLLPNQHRNYMCCTGPEENLDSIFDKAVAELKTIPNILIH